MSLVRAIVKNAYIKNKLIRKLHDIFVVEAFWGTINSIAGTLENLSRAFAYARFGYTNVDFDFTSVYRIMRFKLKRLHGALALGHAEHDPDSLKALQTAIKLTGRLTRDRYECMHYRAHDKKWGKFTTTLFDGTEATEGMPYYMINSRRPGVKTPEDKKQERDESRACYVKGEVNRKADLDSLNEILKTYSKHWWD